MAKEPPETPQRNILGTPRRTTATGAGTASMVTGGQGSIGGGIERMVGVTSVNLGGIEVDVEDVADRLRRLKVWIFRPCPRPLGWEVGVVFFRVIVDVFFVGTGFNEGIPWCEYTWK